MFSGRYDLKAMQCQDGSYFIDRDGSHFGYILNYLRNGVLGETFSKLPSGTASELLREARFYQLDGLIKDLHCEINVITSDIIMSYLSQYEKSSCLSFSSRYCHISSKEIILENKNMKEFRFIDKEFGEAVSFIDCNLSNSIFHRCEFQSDVTFKNCVLVNATFLILCFREIEKTTENSPCKRIHYKFDARNVSFTDFNSERASFDLRSKLQSAGITPTVRTKVVEN